METQILHELVQRGTPDFPVSFHRMDSTHPGYRMRLQWHNDFEIERVLEGQMTVTLENRNYTLCAGDSVLIPGGVVHAVEPHTCVYECIVFPADLLYVTHRTRSLVKNRLQGPAFFREDAAVDRLFSHMQAPREDHEFAFFSDLFDMVQRAAEQTEGRSVTDEYKMERIKTAIRYIEEHAQRNIPLAELSAVCSMSPNYFCSFFKEVTGKTPGDYITTFRMEAAARLLLAGKSVTEAAFECGYNDVSYFISVFKKKSGHSPKHYVKIFHK